MAFILDIRGDVKNPEEFRAVRKVLDTYYEYLNALGDRLPASVRQFVLSPWYRDSESHQCPYDAWLETAQIVEPAEGSRSERRSIDFEIRLLGPYHDGHIVYKYANVLNYSLVMPVGNHRLGGAGHDGWQID